MLSHRPFPALQPYAEAGPIFLCANPCEAYDDTAEPAAEPVFATRPAMLIRGYGADDRIVYGTGKSVPGSEVLAEAAATLERDDVAYVHVRSGTDSCYQARIERA